MLAAVERSFGATSHHGRRRTSSCYGSIAMASRPETDHPRQPTQQRSPSPATRRQPLWGRRDARRAEKIRSGLLLPRDRRSVAAPPRPRRRDVFGYAPQAGQRRTQTRCCHRPAASAAEILHCAIQSAVGANRLSSDAPKGCERSFERLASRLLSMLIMVPASGLVTLLNEVREKAACRKGCVS